MHPFSVTINYTYGSIDGVVRADSKPNIIIYQIPRVFAEQLKQNTELKQSGIYLLFDESQNALYVGQADSRNNGEGVLNRVLEPHSSISNWNSVFILIAGNSQLLTATELNHLEWFFYNEAVQAGRYKITNGNEPHSRQIDTTTEILLSPYKELALFILQNHFKCRAFLPPRGITHEIGKTLYLNNIGRDVNVTGVMQTMKGKM